jgi:hypothetical protein
MRTIDKYWESKGERIVSDMKRQENERSISRNNKELHSTRSESKKEYLRDVIDRQKSNR